MNCHLNENDWNGSPVAIANQTGKKSGIKTQIKCNFH